ncbi:MAG TPA: hypothetical protein VMV03_16345 [Spirochaetia bacterium]|nr:hypothetical protein [Spirochaetia bacterium]
MIAYVFCHWKRADVPAGDYETRQKAFHAALEASPPPGFLRSFSVVLFGAPWAAGGAESYEDWYLVDSFASLAAVNEGAVTGPRSGPHEAAAAGADGGAGGVYLLRQGTAVSAPRYAQWFAKPPGMTYAALFLQVGPLADTAGGTLWMRQMTLGPAREFCVHTAEPLALPSSFDVLRLPLRPVWPTSR